MILLIALFLVMHSYLFYMRYVKFYSKPKLVKLCELNSVLSPVEGRVVYINKYVDINSFHLKCGRRLDITLPENLVGEELVQIGIYMSPFDNHHIITPTYDRSYTVERIGDGWSDMLSWVDHLFPFRYLIFKNWWNKKDFVKINVRDNFIFKSFFMTMIYDKYVNKLTPMDTDAWVHGGFHGFAEIFMLSRGDL